MLGLGTDIIEIDRIRSSVSTYQNRFLNKIFTPKEQEYCLSHRDPSPSLAARFAAKEAAAKALGCGFGKQLSWLDLEILNNEQGRPTIQCSNTQFHSPLFLLSMSHCRQYAVATVIWVNRSV